MTRRDFELIANQIKLTQLEFGDSWDCAPLQALATNLASELYGTNPRFDRDRFMRACGF